MAVVPQVRRPLAFTQLSRCAELLAPLPPVAVGPADPWVSALAVLSNSDLVASGSGDGFVKLWQATVPAASTPAYGERASLTNVASIPVVRRLPHHFAAAVAAAVAAAWEHAGF